MGIKNKIVIPFTFSVIVFGLVMGYVVVKTSEESIQTSVNVEASLIAERTLNALDLMVSERVDTVEAYAHDVVIEPFFLENINFFNQLSNRDSYIKNIDDSWISQTQFEFADEITNNELSEELRHEMQVSEFYIQKYGYDIFPEVFVTNMYGVNVAQTNKTTDYYQADEEWWQSARKDGIYIDSAFDLSADLYAVGISVAITDEQGNFLGVLKTVYNVQEMSNVLKRGLQLGDESALVKQSKIDNIALLENDGRIIYSNRDSLDDVEYYPNEVWDKIVSLRETSDGVKTFIATDSLDDKNKLYAFDSTEGFGVTDDLDWVLLVSHDYNEALALATRLRNLIIGVMMVFVLIVIFVAYLIASSVLKPIEKLRKVSIKVNNGDYSQKVQISSNDEVGQFSRVFNEMIEKERNFHERVKKEVDEKTKEIQEGKAIDDAILKSIGNGLIVVNKKGLVKFINHAAETLLGVGKDEVIGKSADNILKKETEKGERVPFNEYVLSKVMSGEKVVADVVKRYYMVRKDGTRFPATISVTPVVMEGSIVGAVEIFSDATREVEVDKAKTEFVSLASHQLRTPLSTINWYTEMLIAGDAGKINQEQKEFLEEIYSGNQRMVGLVNALLNVSRIEAGTLSIKNNKVPLVKMIDEVLSETESSIKEKNLEVVFPKHQYKKDEFVLLSDPNIIHIIIQNLISNAVKYTPDKGTIKIDLEKNKNNIVFSVKDTGYGIPKDQQKNIFTKLFRARNVQQVETDGTGLGLYMVKKIMEKLGGDAWFESEENKGSTFFVSWPISGTREHRGVKGLISEKYIKKNND